MLLYRIGLFIKGNKQTEELPLGADAWFEPILIRNGDCFSFSDPRGTGGIVNESTEEELVASVLTEVERVYDLYRSDFVSDDSAAKDLEAAIKEFRRQFDSCL